MDGRLGELVFTTILSLMAAIRKLPRKETIRSILDSLTYRLKVQTFEKSTLAEIPVGMAIVVKHSS